MWTLLTRVTGVLAALAGVAGHGYLAEPAARNVVTNYEYCPACLNGPGVCGDRKGSRDNARPGRVVAEYKAGGTLRARAVITANHVGRWWLELATSPAMTKFTKLKLTDGGTYVYLPSSASASTATFRVPKTTCANCVLRWRWETGNSCTPVGTPAKYAQPGLDACGVWMEPERFVNCADIRIT